MVNGDFSGTCIVGLAGTVGEDFWKQKRTMHMHCGRGSIFTNKCAARYI